MYNETVPKNVEELDWKERAALRETETEWLPLEPIKKFNDLPPETIKAVARQKEVCPICANKGGKSIRFRGTITGLTERTSVNCCCGSYRLFWLTFSQLVPQHDRQVQMSTLQPSDQSQLSIWRQEEVIMKLRAEPRKSYALFGPAGTSKTTFSVALFRNRVWKWVQSLGWVGPWEDSRRKCPIYRVSAKTLLEDFVKESMHEEEKGKRIHPIIDRATIKKLGEKGALFIEEIDKVHYTEFKTNALFELIDACYENGMQLVFNTNLTLDKFVNQFGPETGPAIARRVGEMCEILDFFEDKP